MSSTRNEPPRGRATRRYSSSSRTSSSRSSRSRSSRSSRSDSRSSSYSSSSCSSRSPVSRSRRSPPPPLYKVLVTGLTKNVNKEHLQEIFHPVKTVEFLRDKETGTPGGSAYVFYVDLRQARKAVQYLNGAQIDGQEVACAITDLPPVRRLPSPQRKDYGKNSRDERSYPASRRRMSRSRSPRRRRSSYDRSSPARRR
ncbi:hypothetical protein DFJ77DRAFT_26113 [Powellomyces hirtus]|nr:hypothetical protein DFJ77DRAFT_26113 [Powellomyces hirtus]